MVRTLRRLDANNRLTMTRFTPSQTSSPSQIPTVLLLVVIVFALCTSSHAIPSTFFNQLPTRVVRSAESEYDQCFYQSNNAKSKLLKMTYGQCMSMNGPDGCCLDGHYKPGICPNLGHICCTKPDPDCSNMRNNKDIARQMLKQRREHFKLFVKENADEKSAPREVAPSSLESWSRAHLRPPRSNIPQIRINFEIEEMPAHMQLDPVTFVTDALDRHKRDCDKAADYLCRMLDQKYPESSNWNCVVGTEFGFSIEAPSGKYMLFYIGTVHRIQVMAFVPKTPDESR